MTIIQALCVFVFEYRLGWGSLIAGQFVDERFLLGLHLQQTLILYCESFQFCLLFVEEVVELHHLALPILALTLPLVALTQCT